MRERAHKIHFRLKKNGKVYAYPETCLGRDGWIYTNIPELQSDGTTLRVSYKLGPDDYELIKENDYIAFRNNAAKDIFYILLSAEPETKNVDNIIDKSIEYANKLIDKLGM